MNSFSLECYFYFRSNIEQRSICSRRAGLRSFLYFDGGPEAAAEHSAPRCDAALTHAFALLGKRWNGMILGA